MSSALGALQLVLAVVLIAAAGGKLIRGREMVGALRLSRVPATPARILSAVVPALEIVLGILLLATRDVALQITFVGATLMLTAFTGWLVWVRTKRLGIRCGCFGATSKEVTNLTLTRNVVLVATSAVGVILSAAESSALPDPSVYWLMTSGCIAATVLLGAAFNQVRGHLVLSLETMKRRRDMASGIEV